MTLNAATVNLNSNVTTDGQHYNAAVVLGVSTTLTSTANSDIVFSKTLDSAAGFDLTVNTTGTTTLAARSVKQRHC